MQKNLSEFEMEEVKHTEKMTEGASSLEVSGKKPGAYRILTLATVAFVFFGFSYVTFTSYFSLLTEYYSYSKGKVSWIGSTEVISSVIVGKCCPSH